MLSTDHTHGLTNAYWPADRSEPVLDQPVRARWPLLAPRLRSMRSLLVTAVSLLVTTGTSSAADFDIGADMRDPSIIYELSADHPMGTKATVSLVWLKRALHLNEPILSTFIVDYLPSGSAVLHRSPIGGYVLATSRAVGCDPSASMGGGHGHLSLRPNLGRAGLRQQYRLREREHGRARASACRAHHERHRLPGTRP